MAMKLDGAVALVTGTSRGVGVKYVDALLARGAAKVYATARDPAAVIERHADAWGPRVEVFGLDVTDAAQVADAANRCADLTVLINNAGINRMQGFVAARSATDARAEMATNYFGTLSMVRAFASTLGANGGGAIVNMLSILARATMPVMGSLCASKAAAFALTQGVRAELRAQGTQVIAVMPGAIDTDMSRDFPPPKLAPEAVVAAALDAVEAGVDDVYPGAMAEQLAAGLARDYRAVEAQLAKRLPR
jgi:NAD(P)-dependent dehydrogenase (short-subunit alcohol dehydrogenase family)